MKRNKSTWTWFDGKSLCEKLHKRRTLEREAHELTLTPLFGGKMKFFFPNWSHSFCMERKKKNKQSNGRREKRGAK